MLTIIDTGTDSIIRQIKDVGERGVFPYTVTKDNSIAYVCLGGHIGFDVVNLETGKRRGKWGKKCKPPPFECVHVMRMAVQAISSRDCLLSIPIPRDPVEMLIPLCPKTDELASVRHVQIKP